MPSGSGPLQGRVRFPFGHDRGCCPKRPGLPLRRGSSSSVSVGVTYRQDRNLCYTYLAAQAGGGDRRRAAALH